MAEEENRVIESEVTAEIDGKRRKGVSYQATTSTEGPIIVWDEKIKTKAADPPQKR